MKKYFNVLSHSPLFSGIAEHEIDAILSCLVAESRAYEKNQFILYANDVTSQVGIVLSGSAGIIKEDFWGNRNLISKVTPGQLFAETYACVEGSRLSVSVVCNERSEVLFFDAAHILTPCSSSCKFHSQLIFNFIAVLAQKNLLMNEKLTHMSKRTTKDKLLSYLSSQSLKEGSSTFKIPFDRQQLADYLSVDRSAMSSLLSKMRADGLLDFKKNEFTLYKNK